MSRDTTLATDVERGGVLGAGVIDVGRCRQASGPVMVRPMVVVVLSLDVGRRCFVAGHVEANGAGDFGCDRPVVRLGEPDKVSVQLEGEA